MNYQSEIYEKSNPELIIELGERFKTYRLQCRMTQQEVSDKAGVSVFTIRAFETGRALNITMSTFCSLLRAVGFLEEIDKLLPSLPPSHELMMQLQKRQPKRIKHGK